MRLKVFLVFALAALVFISCGNFENIEIGEPKEVNVKGFEENFLVIDVVLPVENPTIHSIVIKNIDVRVFLQNKYIGKLVVDENIRIKPKSNTTYELPVKVRLANLLGAAFIMMNLKKGSESDIRLEGEIQARSLFITKTVEINENRKMSF
jgi:LEA14-like dessication related protein